jgi:hypothetical protein
VSSRLVRSPGGRAVAVEITTSLPDLEVGHRFVVLGTEIGSSGVTFTGAPTGRPPLPDETAKARRGVGVERVARTWTDADREEARRLQGEGLSWAQIAERVCGDTRYKPTVGTWLRQATVAGNGDSSWPTSGPNGSEPARAAMRPHSPDEPGNPHG